ncbi:hypothetical protein ACD954_19020, partial [Escherichia coli]
SLKTSIKTITYLSDIGCLEIQGASLLNLRKDNLVIPDILCQAYVDVIHKRFQLTPFVVTNGAIVIHTQRLKSDPGGNLLS